MPRSTAEKMRRLAEMFLQPSEEMESVDCLTMNIYAPEHPG